METNTEIKNQANGDFGTSILDATVHFFITIAYVLFGVPFALWSKAVNRLAKQRGENSLVIGRINSFWPFFSFIKKLIFEFFIDAIIFILYPIGIIVAFYQFFDVVTTKYLAHPFMDALEAWIVIIIAFYYTPIIFSLIRDFLQYVIVMPCRKYVSWLIKPAQHYDLNIKK